MSVQIIPHRSIQLFARYNSQQFTQDDTHCTFFLQLHTFDEHGFCVVVILHLHLIMFRNQEE